MKGRIVSIFIIIAILISGFLASAIPQNTQIDDTPETSNPVGKRVWFITRAWATGDAIKGRQFGVRGTIGIIKFDYVAFNRLRFFPVRWELVDFQDVTAIMFGLDQDIPSGPFDFERDWVNAIVFK